MKFLLLIIFVCTPYILMSMEQEKKSKKEEFSRFSALNERQLTLLFALAREAKIMSEKTKESSRRLDLLELVKDNVPYTRDILSFMYTVPINDSLVIESLKNIFQEHEYEFNILTILLTIAQINQATIDHAEKLIKKANKTLKKLEKKEKREKKLSLSAQHSQQAVPTLPLGKKKKRKKKKGKKSIPSNEQSPRSPLGRVSFVNPRKRFTSDTEIKILKQKGEPTLFRTQSNRE